MGDVKTLKDNVVPGDKWEFNKDVADCFEDMLSRSIPQYDVMRKSVFDLVSYWLDRKNKDSSKPFSMIDIGCSDGLALKDFIQKYQSRGNYLGIDISEPMLDKARERFKEEIDRKYVSIENFDLRSGFPDGSQDIILAVLCLLFTPIQYRQNIIQNIYDHTNEGGMCIVVEKVLGNTAPIDDMMVDTYYDMKRQNGYSEEQINRKKMSLEGVQVPLTSDWNKNMFKQAGFRQVDVFWRWMNFEGYVLIK